MRPRAAVAIAVGAIAGAALRWGVTLWSGPGGIDLALLVVNTVGAALLGFVAELGPPAHRRTGSSFQPLIGAGFCGALTTWSSLALRTAEQLRDAAAPAAATWLVANILLGCLAASAGRALVRASKGSTP